jgi:hypothetical protein
VYHHRICSIARNLAATHFFDGHEPNRHLEATDEAIPNPTLSACRHLKVTGLKETDMATPIIAQEIYLIERYISAGYFEKLRDTWAELIAHVEGCLFHFMDKLPVRYRRRPLPEQPDAVWGELVLPNFRDTYQSLCDGYIRLSDGDIGGLSHCHGPLNDFKGQMEFWSGWMDRADQNRYGELLHTATNIAGNIMFTEEAVWKPFNLSVKYDEGSRGPLNPPASWPTYSIVAGVAVVTGASVTKAGIYVPDIDNSCAQFLSTEYSEAPAAMVLVRMKDLLHPVTGKKYSEAPEYDKQPCIWTLVERTSDSSAIATAPTLALAERHRVPGGDKCPETGYYFTAAKADSRRRFKNGDILPTLDTAYGTTIWQWDSLQET